MNCLYFVLCGWTVGAPTDVTPTSIYWLYLAIMSPRDQNESMMKTTPTNPCVTQHVEYLLSSMQQMQLMSTKNYSVVVVVAISVVSLLHFSASGGKEFYNPSSHKDEKVLPFAISPPAIARSLHRSLQRVFNMSDIEVPSPPFEIGDLHTNALLKLLHCHHSSIKLGYSQLSDGTEVACCATHCVC